MSITSSSVLVELNISVWTANKLDRNTTNKLTLDSRATADAAQVRKNLMAGTTMRKEIADYAAGCRLWHNSRTLPWADRGPRLLPTSLFLSYKSEVNVRRNTFLKMKSNFVTEYPNLVSISQMHLGDLHDPNDYPDVDEVASKFDFKLVFSPVPESGDFRLDIPQQELDAMRAEYDMNFTTRVEEAMRAPWGKLHEMLSGMSAKLAGSDSETKQRWHDTFITNAQDMCSMLTHLNVTGDPKLEEARRKLEQAIFGLDIDAIKEGADVRTDLKAKVDSILSGYDW